LPVKNPTDKTSSKPHVLRAAPLKSNADIKSLGLDQDIDLIQISASDEKEWKGLELLGNIRFGSESSGQSSQRRLGTYGIRRVVGEIKKFRPVAQDYHDLRSAQPPEPILHRVHQLAAVLHRVHSTRARLLKCRGFFRDLTSLSYVFVFDFPDRKYNDPIALHDFLSDDRYAGQKPSMDHRLNLALTLAIALFQFHAVGWVHKSFRSDNVIFSPGAPGAFLQADLDQLWLLGFEYAREDPGFSDNPNGPTANRKSGIYRHPDRWGEPTRKYEKLHDVYSLGLVLLEIGLWKPISKLDYYAFEQVTYEDRFDVQKLFKQQAESKLPFLVGKLYTDVVVKCLMGEFVSVDDGSSVRDEDLYRQQACIMTKPQDLNLTV